MFVVYYYSYNINELPIISIFCELLFGAYPIINVSSA